MKNEILKKLNDLEKIYSVKILFASESGSRAWGFSSVDSDYDVRFIYIRNYFDYLSLTRPADTICPKIDGVFDINGWDVVKYLLHIGKSNAQIIEWIYSPQQYMDAYDFKDIMIKTSKKFYDKKRMLAHYFGLAKSFKEKIFSLEKIRLKDYFYALRSLFCCKWIMLNESPPPVDFFDLISRIQIEKDIREIINDINRQKQKTVENEVQNKIAELDCFIADNIVSLNSELDNLTSRQIDNMSLNKIFLSILDKVWNTDFEKNYKP